MEFPILETKRLNLLEIKEDHVDHIFIIFSNKEVTKYYGMSPFTQKEQAENIIQSFSKNFQEKRSIRWGIVLKETGEFVGTVGLNNLLLSSKRTEIGYDLLPEYWRKGIISEAVESVVHYCFEMLDLYRIGAVTFPENESSYKLLLKLGFKKEGLLRGYIYQNDKSNDAFVFSLIKPDWKK
ncbi:N-acetyltransferase [Psychrobacillus glaciei]|uniref:N-acetyltransferase n=1 Tax=Psychrobacillus glaciei TaxID=2283160 RepID=A0A5J6SN22_9BACI|nr:GNAT family N-acetyltransferase [Psychrobacillus glaciei]QFF99092.1 N-acetyltransferase [Psychrobacillus glaciei]